MYRSSAFCISYFGKRKEEETKFAKKNIKVPISAFRSAETGSRKNEKNKKKGHKLVWLPHSAWRKAKVE